MIEVDEGMYDAITQYASQDKISYVHFRVRTIDRPLWRVQPRLDLALAAQPL